jgi:anti-sigma regulatory factor (Ser/Thr protein kinase)
MTLLGSHRVNFQPLVANGREAARQIRFWLTQFRLTDEQLFACELALTEAANNAVQHVGAAGRE